jgi:hypothetical protein
MGWTPIEEPLILSVLGLSAVYDVLAHYRPTALDPDRGTPRGTSLSESQRT